MENIWGLSKEWKISTEENEDPKVIKELKKLHIKSRGYEDDKLEEIKLNFEHSEKAEIIGFLYKAEYKIRAADFFGEKTVSTFHEFVEKYMEKAKGLFEALKQSKWKKHQIVVDYSPTNFMFDSFLINLRSCYKFLLLAIKKETRGQKNEIWEKLEELESEIKTLRDYIVHDQFLCANLVWYLERDNISASPETIKFLIPDKECVASQERPTFNNLRDMYSFIKEEYKKLSNMFKEVLDYFQRPTRA